MIRRYRIRRTGGCPGLNAGDASSAGTAGETASGQLADSNIELIGDDFRPISCSTRWIVPNSAMFYMTDDVTAEAAFSGTEGLSGREVRYLLEDGTKLFGIFAWVTFHVRAAWDLMELTCANRR